MKLKVRRGKRLPVQGIERILIRGTNWIGDVVMTLPAVAAVRKTWPTARISVLAKPWVGEVYRFSPDVDEVIPFEEPGRHASVRGKLRLAGDLRKRGYGMRDAKDFVSDLAMRHYWTARAEAATAKRKRG